MGLPEHRLADLRIRLLAWLAGRPASAGAEPSLSEADSAVLAHWIAGHRLAPRLHALAQSGVLPAGIPAAQRAAWKESYRRQAMLALAQGAALNRIADVLGAASIPVVPLKGAWLAQHAYPAPAERPLRDLDILVPANEVPRAYALLRKAGWEGPALSPAELCAMLAQAVHAPPLLSPDGIACELHARSWMLALESGLGPSHASDARLLAAAAASPNGMAYPEAHALLAHLCVHAAYAHGLDVGPLVLSDLSLLCDTVPIAWDRFWAEAANGGYAQGAMLLVHAVDRCHRPGFAAAAHCSHLVSPDLLARVPALLLAEPDTRREALLWGRLLGARRAANWSGAAQAGWSAARRDVRDRAARPLGPAGTIAERLGRAGQVARRLAQQKVRRAGRDQAALAAFLRSDEP